MNKHLQKLGPSSKELLFQIVLTIVVFLFYSIDRKNPQIEGYEFAFFLSLASCAFLINYLLLPFFLYKKQFFHFFLYTGLLILAAVLMEELVLEKIYFPDTRGSKFSNIFSTSIGILPVVAVLVGFKFGWDLIEKQQQLEDLEAVVKDSELQFLNSQINPHFLFNNLNNLYAHAIEESPKTPEIILNLSATLRYMLYDCKATSVPLNKELEHLENFIGISQLQIEDRSLINFTYPSLASQYQIAPLILIVFVENAFKHSTASQFENISIQIKVQITEKGYLEFSCINSFNEDSNIDHLPNGIGLENVQKRLQLLYPNVHTLEIKKTKQTYGVFLSLQLKSSKL
ncbi:MAG: putative two-component system sensor protein, no kinase domain [uncultured Aureispira sp.]|uniref:Putative two-component system sensor protein, no kinase domain n=1 Tax=uncultured Aureispira sp. TaxID=1331704 RepID=A0A6S6STA9_9BACT|nr:MAG: putative two-component system sensor protein, no kinase domain [uncultured Aureispira sp.]